MDGGDCIPEERPDPYLRSALSGRLHSARGMERVRYCMWPECTANVWERHLSLKLCQIHALTIWSEVESDLEAKQPEPEPEPAQPVTTGTIYYLRVGDQIKVGYASDLLSRMKSYPPNAQLLATEPGTRANETVLHNLLVEYRVAGREWYRPDPELLDRIERVKQEHGEPGDPFAARRAKPRPDQAMRLRQGRRGWAM